MRIVLLPSVLFLLLALGCPKPAAAQFAGAPAPNSAFSVPQSHLLQPDELNHILADLGFTQVHVLYFANNFGTDWIEKGFPVERAQ